jgi:hypothetical protein
VLTGRNTDRKGSMEQDPYSQCCVLPKPALLTEQ